MPEGICIIEGDAGDLSPPIIEGICINDGDDGVISPRSAKASLRMQLTTFGNPIPTSAGGVTCVSHEKSDSFSVPCINIEIEGINDWMLFGTPSEGREAPDPLEVVDLTDDLHDTAWLATSALRDLNVAYPVKSLPRPS